MGLSDYGLLAELFEYPVDGFPETVQRVRQYVADNHPGACASMDAFCEHLPIDSLLEIQELYTRSFDVQAVTTLDVGYVLFGEDYKRGEILSNLAREHRKAGNECGTELPDHLANLLRLIPKLADSELRNELVCEVVGPALRIMIGEFAPERLAKNDALYEKHHKTLIASNPETRTLYRHALQTLYDILGEDFVLTEKPLLEQTSDFLKSVAKEMAIEASDGKVSLPLAADEGTP